MVKVKPLSEAKTNYESASGSVGEKYKKGIQRTTDWSEKASSDSAEQLYAQRVQESIANKSRQKALRKISNAEWQERAVNKGAAIIGQAMRQSSDKWASGFQPFAQALENVSLPAKTADPMANIDNRVKPIVKAMVDTKKAQLG